MLGLAARAAETSQASVTAPGSSTDVCPMPLSVRVVREMWPCRSVMPSRSMVVAPAAGGAAGAAGSSAPAGGLSGKGLRAVRVSAHMTALALTARVGRSRMSFLIRRRDGDPGEGEERNMRNRMRPGDTGHYFSRHSLTFIRQRSCTPPPGACQRRRDLPPRRERGEERATRMVALSADPTPPPSHSDGVRRLVLRGDGRRRLGREPGSARYQTMPWAIMTSATRVKPAALAPST